MKSLLDDTHRAAVEPIQIDVSNFSADVTGQLMNCDGLQLVRQIRPRHLSTRTDREDVEYLRFGGRSKSYVQVKLGTRDALVSPRQLLSEAIQVYAVLMKPIFACKSGSTRRILNR